jgi:hypothetical protein
VTRGLTDVEMMRKQVDARQVAAASGSGPGKAEKKDKGKGVLRSTVPARPLKRKVSTWGFILLQTALIVDRLRKKWARKRDRGFSAINAQTVRRTVCGLRKTAVGRRAKAATSGASSALSAKFQSPIARNGSGRKRERRG